MKPIADTVNLRGSRAAGTALAAAALAVLGAGCGPNRPEYAVVNAAGTTRMPKRVILFPFILRDHEAKSGFTGADLEIRGTEAQVVVRDELEPYFLGGMESLLTVRSFVEPERVGHLSIKGDLGSALYVRANDILGTYARHSAVDVDALDSLIDTIDERAHGIVFIRIDLWDCEMRKERLGAIINLRGYFFVRGALKAAWVAQDWASYSTEPCNQAGYGEVGKLKLDLFLRSLPFQKPE